MKKTTVECEGERILMRLIGYFVIWNYKITVKDRNCF
jgi:hypothetical protein